MSKPNSKSDQSAAGTPSKRWLSIVLLVVVVGLGLFGLSRLFGPGSSDQPGENPVEIEIVDTDDPRVPVQVGKTWDEIDDPAADGWDTEVFNIEAGKQLKKLGTLLTQRNGIDAASVKKLIASDFACGALWPADIVTVLGDQHLKVDRIATTLNDRSFRERPTAASERQHQGTVVRAMIRHVPGARVDNVDQEFDRGIEARQRVGGQPGT